MEKLYTEEFDVQFKSKISHLKNYPELLPHIGKDWEKSPIKFLIIAESHYVDKPNGAISEIHANDWYNHSSIDFIWKGKDEPYLNIINTRYNVDFADNVKSKRYKNPYLHYYNMKNEIKENFTFLNDVELIYPYLSYHNYFQRPAYVEVKSIDNNEIDNEIAYSTFKSIIEIIEPDKIIFVSNLSFKTFLNSKEKHNEKHLFENNIYSVPHAGSAWWNIKSAKYGKVIGTNINRTGRERFVDIITSKIP